MYVYQYLTFPFNQISIKYNFRNVTPASRLNEQEYAELIDVNKWICNKPHE